MADDDIVLLPELKVFHPVGQQSWEQRLDSFVDRVLLFVQHDVALTDLGQRKWYSWYIGKTMQLKSREIAKNHKDVNNYLRLGTYLSISP